MTTSERIVKLTEAQEEVLQQLAMRPNGMPFRTRKHLVFELCRMGLVCDPHDYGISIFTRLTDAGRTALSKVKVDSEKTSQSDHLADR